VERPILGQIILEITCADCADFLNRIQIENIRAKGIRYLGGLELQITVSGADFQRVQQIVYKLGGSIRAKRVSGIHRSIAGLKKHAVIPVIVLLLFLLTVLLPTRVLFISVDGNLSVPENKILAEAEKCGLCFGAKRQSVRSEAIKNALLQEIPQLQWAGINTRGCTATISVKEKTTQDAKETTDNQVCSIVAARDGIIQDCTVYRGNQLCSAGQAVKAGQTLVSGYTDCGTVIKATKADAEITALTFRNLEILTPAATVVRGQQIGMRNFYTIRIGKKLINLSKDSGNSQASCVKIYSERSVRLPGGFALPISIIRETVISYENAEQIPIITEEEQWLEYVSQTYLKSSMIAGKVVSAQTELIRGDGFSCLRGLYACIEMIGEVRYEQMLLKD